MGKVHYHIVTLFPDYFLGALQTGLMGKATEKGIFSVSVYNLRDYSPFKHHQVDDESYGGGPGMVLRIEPLVASLRAIVSDIKTENHEVIAFTPSGNALHQDMVQAYADRIGTQDLRHLILYCGRYEGFDERFLVNYVHKRIRVSEAVFMGGEAAALVFYEAVSRLLPGVVGNPGSLVSESFGIGGLDYPVYTRPPVFEGSQVPKILLEGDHEKIAAWRKTEAQALAEKYQIDTPSSLR